MYYSIITVDKFSIQTPQTEMAWGNHLWDFGVAYCEALWSVVLSPVAWFCNLKVTSHFVETSERIVSTCAHDSQDHCFGQELYFSQTSCHTLCLWTYMRIYLVHQLFHTHKFHRNSFVSNLLWTIILPKRLKLESYLIHYWPGTPTTYASQCRVHWARGKYRHFIGPWPWPSPVHPSIWIAQWMSIRVFFQIYTCLSM